MARTLASGLLVCVRADPVGTGTRVEGGQKTLLTD